MSLDASVLSSRSLAEAATLKVASLFGAFSRAVRAAGYSEDAALRFGMRYALALFAEQLDWLPRGGIARALRDDWILEPGRFSEQWGSLWRSMRADPRFSFARSFFFADDGLDCFSLDRALLGRLLLIALEDWSLVDPVIFGMLLEDALDPRERQKLGAHYTPRASLERLLRPALEEPIREEWQRAQTEACGLFRCGRAEEARARAREFLRWLRQLRLLDPACGTGNCLVVALELMQAIEADVFAFFVEMGDCRAALPGEGVLLRQFLGIEIKPWAREVAELALTVGFWRGHCRMHGRVPLPDLLLEDSPGIECRDALLDWTSDPPRRAAWPQADFILGNPPFLGSKRMRSVLGDSYVDMLRSVWKEIPDGADLSLYWWCAAAELVRSGVSRRFGLITTNSIKQAMNRKATESTLFHRQGASVVWAIADHPWRDSSTGAAVRIAMTVVAASPSGALGAVIASDLRSGPAVGSVVALRSNVGMASVGLVRFAEGFFLDAEECPLVEPEVVFSMAGGRDINQRWAPRLVIDLYPMDREQAERVAPKAFQRLLTHVKPGRDRIRDPSSRERFWRFGRDKPELRRRLASLPRYIATSEVAKHRIFVFLSSEIRPDHSLVVVPSDDAFLLGVLSSRVHVCWALATGGTLENRPRYNRRVCFDPFPFPDCAEPLRERIATIAEAMDRHRKAFLAEGRGRTLTGLYNQLEKLRSGVALDEHGSVSALWQMHNNLDAAVLEAYGFPMNLDENALLERLVSLNAERAAEEKRGVVRWLRPEMQAKLRG